MAEVSTERVKQNRRGAPLGSLNRQSHGGASAVKKIQHGTEFTGLAAIEERAVKADLQAGGRAAMVEELAVRLTTASRLYWSAICTTVEQVGNDGQLTGEQLQQLTSYSKTFRSLANAAVRAWREHREETGTTDDRTLDAALVAAREHEQT